MQQRHGRTSNGVTSGRSPLSGSDRWNSSRTWCDVTSTTRDRERNRPALHTLFRAKRDEIARQITALEDRDTSRFVYGSLQLYGGIAQPRASAAEELLETIPARPQHPERDGRGVAEAARAEFDRYRAVYLDFPAHIEVRDDISELMVSFGRLLIPEAAAWADRVEPLLHHEVGTHVVTYQNGARQPLTLLTIGLPGYDETQEGLAVLAEYLTGGLDPRRLRVLAARVVAIGKMLDGAGFLEIFESLRRTSDTGEDRLSIAIRVVVGGGSGEGRDLPPWDHAHPRSPRGGQQPRCPLRRQARVGPHPVDPGPARPRGAPSAMGPSTRSWTCPALERLDRLRAGASVTDLYEGDVPA